MRPLSPNMADPSRPAESRLSAGAVRQIGFLPLLALFYGYTASGPFGYEEIFSSSGPGMALVFLTFVPFFWSIPISFASAEMNSILPVQGGFYRWSRAAFGDFWGFQCGWWNWTGTFLLNSLYGVLFMDYLKDYIPITPNEKWVGASLVLILIAAMNARGIQVAGWLHRAAGRDLYSRRMALRSFNFSLALQSDSPIVPPGHPFGSVFGKGLALAMWDYAGYEQLSVARRNERSTAHFRPRAGMEYADEHSHLHRFRPRSRSQCSATGKWDTGYIVTASQLIGGPALGAAMLVASIIGVASLSNGTILYTTRIPAAMAEDGYLPAWLGKIHPRYGTPVRAIAVSTVVYCILAKFPVKDLVNIYIWTRIATSMMTVLAAWSFAAKCRSSARFRIPCGTSGIAYILVFPVLFCAVKVYYSETFVFHWAPLLLASGPMAYASPLGIWNDPVAGKARPAKK